MGEPGAHGAPPAPSPSPLRGLHIGPPLPVAEREVQLPRRAARLRARHDEASLRGEQLPAHDAPAGGELLVWSHAPTMDPSRRRAPVTRSGPERQPPHTMPPLPSSPGRRTTRDTSRCRWARRSPVGRGTRGRRGGRTPPRTPPRASSRRHMGRRGKEWVPPRSTPRGARRGGQRGGAPGGGAYSTLVSTQKSEAR